MNKKSSRYRRLMEIRAKNSLRKFLLGSNVNFNLALLNPHPGLLTTDGQLLIRSTAYKTEFVNVP